MKPQSLKIGLIGMGRMGSCLVQGLVDTGKVTRSQIHFTTKHPETAKKAEAELQIKALATNAELVKECEIIILAIKPQNMEEVLTEISKAGSKTVISIVASWTTEQIEKKIGKSSRVIRAMPNTPALVKAGITAFCLGSHAEKEDIENVKMIFEPVGKLVQVDERHMDAVTGLSGCGPAYVYVILESLTDAGIKVGLPRDLASELASQTVLGAAKMLQETGRHPASLKDEVTTPAGCTIDGLLELEEGKLRVTLIKAVVQATKRARELVSSNSDE